MNLCAKTLVQDLNIRETPLTKPLRVGSVNDPDAMICTHKATIRHAMGQTEYQEEFYVAPMTGSPELLLGTPWMERHCPEILRSLEQLGENPPKRHLFGGGGECNSQTCKQCREQRLSLVEEELEWQEKLAARRLMVLHLRAHVVKAIDQSTTPRASRAAQEGDPGIRGLTGNREGWRETIPPEFRDYTEKVFSDSVLKTAAPSRPGFECTITLKDGETLTKHNPYEMPLHQLKKLKELLDNEEAAGVISRSKAPHAVPGFFVTDPGSKQERWVVNYQEVNAKSRKDAYPLPRVNTIIERAASANFISTMDISKAFAMIPMSEDSKELTAFTTPIGMFQYNVMPMGLANAPSIWQRFIDSILGPISHDFCFAYLDDILIVSKTREEHIKHCRQVLEILATHGLHAKPHKCSWFQKEVEFLGYKVIAGKGVTMAADKIQAIRDMKAPKRVSDLRMLLGVFGYNDSFVKHYSDCTAIMTDLLQKDVPWKWTSRHEEAFQTLKERFTEQVVRAGWDAEKPARMKTDASDVSHAVWIEQPVGPEGQWASTDEWQPILLASHKFKDAEKGWDGPDKELFAIVDALKRYRKWLAQPKYPLQIYSDHRNLAKFMFTSNLLKSHDGRLGRWWQELSQANFVIEYTPGKENVEPDWLSRYNLPDSVDLDARQLLPAYRFSPKALADIDSWFRQHGDAVGIRKRLEQSFASQAPSDNESMKKIMDLGDKNTKLNDSPDPVPAPDDASVSMAAPQRLSFLARYRARYPLAVVPFVPERHVRIPDRALPGRERFGLDFGMEDL